MFKELGYERDILNGRAVKGHPYKSDIVATGHHQPKGTRSETIPYFIDQKLIAVCHQYTLPDGSIGASGKPDPKMLEYQGSQFYSHSQIKSQPCDCSVCCSLPEDWSALISK